MCMCMNHTLLLTLFLADNRLAELFFETFQTSSLFFSKDSVLSCYACGKTTGEGYCRML
ncbi:hypothetical protein EON63_11270 [archaeon]|nr:MAG: hypothetical protein EON63_11270 [archaeon]